MIPEVQKKKLQSLRLRSAEIQNFNQETLEIINDVFKEYCLILRRLHEKEPNIFRDFINHDITELKQHVKSAKSNISGEIQQENFSGYKDFLENSIDTAIEYITDYIQ
jgi:F0F1-type ATP synthase membrane subunit b/b'